MNEALWKRNTVPNYEGLHTWVEKQLGKPNKCEFCGITEGTRFHWANKSQEYKKELTDWLRLCGRCHKLYDLGVLEKCKRGHARSPENLYFYPKGRSGRHTHCKLCVNEHKRKALNNSPELRKYHIEYKRQWTIKKLLGEELTQR